MGRLDRRPIPGASIQTVNIPRRMSMCNSRNSALAALPLSLRERGLYGKPIGNGQWTMDNAFMPQRFAILLHSGYGPDHVDFMLEDGLSLATWRLSAEFARLLGDAASQTGAGQAGTTAESAPSISVGTLPARRLGDHRLAYLEYEGPVSLGRGEVRRLDAGTYRTVSRGEDEWAVTLEGGRLRGRICLTRLWGDRWQLTR